MELNNISHQISNQITSITWELICDVFFCECDSYININENINNFTDDGFKPYVDT